MLHYPFFPEEASVAEECGLPSVPRRKLVINLLGLHSAATFPCLGMIMLTLFSVDHLHPKNANDFSKIASAAQHTKEAGGWKLSPFGPEKLPCELSSLCEHKTQMLKTSLQGLQGTIIAPWVAKSIAIHQPGNSPAAGFPLLGLFRAGCQSQPLCRTQLGKLCSAVPAMP